MLENTIDSSLLDYVVTPTNNKSGDVSGSQILRWCPWAGLVSWVEKERGSEIAADIEHPREWARDHVMFGFGRLNVFVELW